MPTSNISSLVAHAKRTFVRNPPSKVFALGSAELAQHVGQLRTLLQSLTAADLNLEESAFLSSNSPTPPIGVIQIFENVDVNVTVFMVKPGQTMPMHDHPSMHGFLKVLAGKCDITAYSKVGKEKAENLKVRLPSGLLLASF